MNQYTSAPPDDFDIRKQNDKKNMSATTASNYGYSKQTRA